MGEAAIIFGNINEFQQNNERTKPFVFHNFQNEIIATTQTKLKKKLIESPHLFSRSSIPKFIYSHIVSTATNESVKLNRPIKRFYLKSI